MGYTSCMRIPLIICMIFLFCVVSAQSCQELAETFDATLEQANAYTLTVKLKQGWIELSHTKIEQRKNAEGNWQLEIVEQRGLQRPEDAGEGSSERQSNATFAPNCDFLTDLRFQGNRVHGDFELPEDNLLRQGGVESYQTTWTYHEGIASYIPESIEVRATLPLGVLPLPVTFVSRFSNWSF